MARRRACSIGLALTPRAMWLPRANLACQTGEAPLAGTESYTLDALNRLTNVTYPNGDVVGYTYDANGNRLTKTFNGTPTNYTYDTADQLTSDGSLTYTYDANGNMTAAGADTFTWDYANRMSGATVGGTASTSAYDANGNTIPTETSPESWTRASLASRRRRRRSSPTIWAADGSPLLMNSHTRLPTRMMPRTTYLQQ